MSKDPEDRVQEKRMDGVAVLLLRRPPLNLLDLAMRDQLRQRMEALSRDAAVKAIVLGTEAEHFCAGADLNESALRTTEAVARSHAQTGHAMTKSILSCAKPVIAALQGVCLGGGFELALACTARVADDTAKVGLPEVHRNLWPGTGGIYLLTQMVGLTAARLMMLEGRQIGVEEALNKGLVDRVVRSGQALDAAVSWASELGGRSDGAWRQITALTARVGELPLDAYLRAEEDAYAAWFPTAHAQAGIQTFLSRRRTQAEQAGGKDYDGAS